MEAASQGLFAGRQAGLHLDPEYLHRRLGELGVECRAGRNAALLQLGSRLPAALLAEKFNVLRSTADRWVKMAGGDWSRYAAERARSAATLGVCPGMPTVTLPRGLRRPDVLAAG